MGKHRNVKSDREFGDGRGAGYKNPPPGWPKGQSGNPSGGRAPRRSSPLEDLMNDFLEELGTEAPTSTGELITVRRGVLRNLVRQSTNNPKIALKVIQVFVDLERAWRAACPATEAEVDDPREDAGLLQAGLERAQEERALAGEADLQADGVELELADEEDGDD